MAVAWCWAELYLSTYEQRLHEWALPQEQCVEGSTGSRRTECFIPASLWQVALPVLRQAVAKTREHRKHDEFFEPIDERYDYCELLGELVRYDYPTHWTLAKRDQYGCWKVVDNESAGQPGVQRVEVMKHIKWSSLDPEEVPFQHSVICAAGWCCRPAPTCSTSTSPSTRSDMCHRVMRTRSPWCPPALTASLPS